MLRQLSIFTLSAAALSAFAAETLESTSESAAARVDFSSAAVRSVGALSEILPFAVNSSSDWVKDGDATVTATVAVEPMNGESAADPSGWIAAGAASPVASVAGEGTAAWMPSVKRYYRARLSVGGTVTETAYFDLSSATDPSLETPRAISSCTILIGAGPYSCTGYPIVPTVTVTDGATALCENADYVLSCSDNVRVGTATVRIFGTGDYAGCVTRTFAISAHEPETAAESLSASLALDSRTETSPRTIPAIGDLYRFAWSSSSDWSAGGDPLEAATLAVSPATATDPADTSTWVASGTASNLVASASGEGVAAAWAPTVVGLYLARLSSGGVDTTAYLDMRETEGLSKGESVAGFTIVFGAASYPCSGYPVVPEVVVSNGTVTLVKDVDYTTAAVSNVNSGVATLIVSGIGKYTGTIRSTFVIAPAVVTEVADDDFGAFALDSTTNDVLNVARAPFDFFVAWNDASSWPSGGVETAGRSARVSVAPLAAPTAEPGAFTVLRDDLTGEGTFTTIPKRGYGLYRIEYLTNGAPAEVWTRVIRNNIGLMLIVR